MAIKHYFLSYYKIIKIIIIVFCLNFRLAVLLDHGSVIKPQYEFVACEDVNTVWLLHDQVTAALRDEEVISAAVPLSMNGVCKMQMYL